MLITPYQLNMRWFEGVVESRQDPLTLGRVQVRVFGIHTEDLSLIPTDELHWMQVMYPVTSPANSGSSESPSLFEATHVIGYFRDGDNCQDGLIIGSVAGIPQKFRDLTKGFNDLRTDLGIDVVPGKPVLVTPTEDGVIVDEGAERQPYPLWIEEPDTSRLNRVEFLPEKTINEVKIKSQALEVDIPIAFGGTFSEPEVPYNAKYPYNLVTEFESGHVMEFDNSPLEERVHIAHRTGSFVEMHKDGKTVYKSAWIKYEHVHGNSYQHVNKSKIVTVEDSYKILINNSKTGQNLEIEVEETGNINISVNQGDYNAFVNGTYNLNVTGDINITSGETVTITAAEDIILNAGGAVVINAGSMTSNIEGSANFNLGNNANFNVGADISFNVGDDVKFKVNDNFVVDADNVTID